MAFGNTITITGNVTGDPELRFTQTGTEICNFDIAWNASRDSEAMFFRVTCWEKLAVNVSESIEKGTRVTVIGRLAQRSWDDKETGQKRYAVDITAEDVGPSLKWATAEVTRNPYDDDGAPAGNQGQAAPSSNFPTDEEPF
ncbi:MAG: single-stranded DNA-binding protein [Acidimicrobiales bacterium]|nr:single-stranded DNA-binding protein [Acidimicrobiales bacterium]